MEWHFYPWTRLLFQCSSTTKFQINVRFIEFMFLCSLNLKSMIQWSFDDTLQCLYSFCWVGIKDDCNWWAKFNIEPCRKNVLKRTFWHQFWIECFWHSPLWSICLSIRNLRWLLMQNIVESMSDCCLTQTEKLTSY